MNKKNKSYFLTVIISCIVIALTSYYAWKLVFFEYSAELKNLSSEPLSYIIALLPLFIIIILSMIGIVVCTLLRKHIMKTDSVAGRFYQERSTIKHRTRIRNKHTGWFMFIRWVCMIFSLIFLAFGTKLIGTVSIPVLFCGITGDKLGGSGCYYLSHLKDLIALSWQQILIFLISMSAFLFIFGRVLCGFFCPMGLLQDIVYTIRQKLGIEGIPLNEKHYNGLKPIKWFLVIVFLCLCFVTGNFCNFCPVVTVAPAIVGFKASLFVSGFVMVFVIVGSFFKRRFWCTICPLGYLVGLVHKISPFQLNKDCQSCTECGACYEACPMGIKNIYTERKESNVTTADCIMCGECVKKCPENNALSITFCRKYIYKASRKSFMSGYRKMENDTDKREVYRNDPR